MVSVAAGAVADEFDGNAALGVLDEVLWFNAGNDIDNISAKIHPGTEDPKELEPAELLTAEEDEPAVLAPTETVVVDAALCALAAALLRRF